MINLKTFNICHILIRDVYRRSCDVSLRRSCVHGVIKCFVESLLFVIL